MTTARRTRYKRRHPVMHLLQIIGGIFFMILGVLGLFLPILQGILFLLIGAALLSPYIPAFRRGKIWMYRRYPRLRHELYRWKRRFRK